jgi:hydroxyquinol 1,2-dioxygenase
MTWEAGYNTVRNLNEDTITQAVLARLADMPDNRLKEIVTKLVQHLHAFARETALTEAEWLQGIEFLTAVGHKCSGQRQEFILLSDTLGLSQLVVAQNHSRPAGATEQTVFGPFHMPGAPRLDAGADIANGAPGEACFVDLQVLDEQGRPVADAEVDVWQADAEGFYDVQDPAWTMADSKLRAVFQSDAQGRVKLRTVLPKSYPIPMDGPVGQMITATHRHPMRPAHLHVMVVKSGFDALITHVFVDGDEYLDSDVVFGVRSSCVGQYLRHEGGTAPDGTTMRRPFYTLDYPLRLHPLA